MSTPTTPNAASRNEIADLIRTIEAHGFVVVSIELLASSLADNREHLQNVEQGASAALRLACRLTDQQMKAEADAARDIAMLLLHHVRNYCVGRIAAARVQPDGRTKPLLN